MPSPDETDWQREMAAEIKRAIEARPIDILDRHESSHVDGDGYTLHVDYTVKPVFSVLVLIKPSNAPDHIPRTVEGVGVELEHGAFVTRFTVDCGLLKGDCSSEWVSLWYRCEVAE